MPRFNGVVQALKYYVKDAKSIRWQNLKSALSQAPFFLSAVGHFFIKNMSMFYLNLKIESAEARSDCVELFTVSNKASINCVVPKTRRKTANNKCCKTVSFHVHNALFSSGVPILKAFKEAYIEPYRLSSLEKN